MIEKIKLEIELMIRKTQKCEFPFENMSDTELKNFSRGKSIQVIQNFFPEITREEAKQMMDYGVECMKKIYPSIL